MKSKLLVAVSAVSVVLALPLLAQGQGGGQWGGGQGGNWDMDAMKTRMVDGAIETLDTDDDGELSKEEFVEMATNERYSSWFEATDDENEEESDDEDAEATEEEEATADESEEGDDESEEDALKKLYEAKFAEVDADDDGSVTSEELTEAFDVDAYMERARERWQQGGGNRQRGGQGGGNWQRPGGGSP